MGKTILKTKILAIGFAFLIFPTAISAEVGLSVAPQKFEVAVFPGGSYKGQFKIHNPSSIALPVDLKVITFGAEDGTGSMVLGKDSSPENPTSWIKFPDANFLLAPKENKRIPFSIDIPPDAPEGGYYLMVQFQPRIPDLYPDRRGARTVPSIGVPVLVATTELALDGSQRREDIMEVTGFAVASDRRLPVLERILNIGRTALASPVLADGPGNIDFGLQVTREKPDRFVLSIRNNDIFHFQPEGKLTVYDFLDREVGSVEIKEQTILPGMSRNFDLMIDDPGRGTEISFRSTLSSIYAGMMVGGYRVKLDLRGQSPVYREIVPLEKNLSFVVLTLTPIIFWGFVLLASIIFIGSRKRMKVALKVFFSSRNG